MADGTIAVSRRDRRPAFQGGSRRERDQEGPEGLEGVEHVLSPPPAQVVFTPVLQPTIRVREERGKNVATCSCSARSRVSASKGTTVAPPPEGFVARTRELLREWPQGSSRAAKTSQTNKKSYPPWLLPSAALPCRLLRLIEERRASPDPRGNPVEAANGPGNVRFATHFLAP